jgi:hypothetical protein
MHLRERVDPHRERPNDRVFAAVSLICEALAFEGKDKRVLVGRWQRFSMSIWTPTCARVFSELTFTFYVCRLLRPRFHRSNGDRGADIDTLRGTNGPDFEGYAVINRPDGFGVCCTCFGGGGKNKKEEILLIKGPYLFVFAKERDPAPKYAIELAHTKTVMQQSSGGVQHMTIETSLGDVEWELTFQKQNIAKLFADAFKQQAAVGEAEEVRKVRMGPFLVHQCFDTLCTRLTKSTFSSYVTI